MALSKKADSGNTRALILQAKFRKEQRPHGGSHRRKPFADIRRIERGTTAPGVLVRQTRVAERDDPLSALLFEATRRERNATLELRFGSVRRVRGRGLNSWW